MLTKDLVRYKIRQNKITPQFINPTSSTYLALAEQLLDVFKSAEGQSRQELLEKTRYIIEGYSREILIARGLEKLLLDRTEFHTAPNEQLIEFRQRLFSRTSSLLSHGKHLSLDAYQKKVQKEFGYAPEEFSEILYADLPPRQPVIKFKTISPERLLHRYNAALVQGLLLHCNELKISIGGSNQASLRQFFKYLRFHQLLATIRKHSDDRFVISVDGPLNLFYKTKKYGLSLANFFPAVLHQPQWELTADIKMKRRGRHQLSLDHSCGIKPYFHQFLAYVPQEIEMFQDNFKKKTPDWEIRPAENFVALEGEYYCFPDYFLKHSSGEEIYLELFHPWHSSHLVSRIQQVEGASNPPLILGAAKVLLKDPLIAETIHGSAYFSRYGFTFREMPTAGQLLKALNLYLESRIR